MIKKNMRKRICMLLSVIIIFIAAFQVYIWTVPVDNVNRADAAVVLGCRIKGNSPTPFLEQRTKRAAQLYKENKVRYIIVSGGKGNGENMSEAQCMKNILVEEGIEEDKILMEDKSENTRQNIKFSNDIIKKNNFNNVIVVSNLFHLRRASIICKKNGVNASYSGTFSKKYMETEIYGGLREVPAIIKDVF